MDETKTIEPTETVIETRVRYIHQDDTLTSPTVFTYEGEGDWVDPGPDGAAAYPWLMNNAIVWVETRTVTMTPWEVE